MHPTYRCGQGGLERRLRDAHIWVSNARNIYDEPERRRFADLRLFLLRLGFVERVRGSHHIFRTEGLNSE